MDVNSQGLPVKYIRRFIHKSHCPLNNRWFIAGKNQCNIDKIIVEMPEQAYNPIGPLLKAGSLLRQR